MQKGISMKRTAHQSPTGFTDESPSLAHVIQVGGEEELFASLRSVLKQAEQGVAIEPSSVVYVSSEAMRHILADSRSRIMQYISRVKQVSSIEALANGLKRERSAVSRDVTMLENFGLLSTQECTHAGHGMRKAISLAHEQLEVRLRFA